MTRRKNRLAGSACFLLTSLLCLPACQPKDTDEQRVAISLTLPEVSEPTSGTEEEVDYLAEVKARKWGIPSRVPENKLVLPTEELNEYMYSWDDTYSYNDELMSLSRYLFKGGTYWREIAIKPFAVKEGDRLRINLLVIGSYLEGELKLWMEDPDGQVIWTADKPGSAEYYLALDQCKNGDYCFKWNWPLYETTDPEDYDAHPSIQAAIIWMKDGEEADYTGGTEVAND